VTHWLGAAIVSSLIQAAPGVAFVLARDMISNIAEPRQVVAWTTAEWTTLWRQHAGNRLMPSVNFDTHTVVAVFLGARPSAGYAAEIVGTRAEGSALVVQWRERQPVRGDVSAAMLTSPAVLATVPKPAGEIRFEKVGS
jgi:hypothetical protein